MNNAETAALVQRAEQLLLSADVHGCVCRWHTESPQLVRDLCDQLATRTAERDALIEQLTAIQHALSGRDTGHRGVTPQCVLDLHRAKEAAEAQLAALTAENTRLLKIRTEDAAVVDEFSEKLTALIDDRERLIEERDKWKQRAEEVDALTAERDSGKQARIDISNTALEHWQNYMTAKDRIAALTAEGVRLRAYVCEAHAGNIGEPGDCPYCAAVHADDKLRAHLEQVRSVVERIQTANSASYNLRLDALALIKFVLIPSPATESPA